MNSDTIFLEAVRSRHLLRISLRSHQGPLGTVADREYPEAEIRERCRTISETLNRRISRGRMNSSDALHIIRETGTILCDLLLTAEIKSYLENASAKFLQVKIDDQLVHIPWELFFVGDTFLCRKFSMGRIVDTRQSFAKCRGGIPTSESIRMLILANPEGDLKNAKEEGESIERICDSFGKKYVSARLLSRSQVNNDALKEKIRSFDFVHYSGHAEFDSAVSDKNGWKLSESYFSPADISEMIGGEMPFFIFSNACQTARTGEWNDHSFSLVNAFLLKGVKHYLGTFWKIADEPGRHFALEFYRHLFGGKSIGESVKQTRDALAEAYGSDYIGWASYLLYGDPSVRYFQNGDYNEPNAADRFASKTDRNAFRSSLYRGGSSSVDAGVKTAVPQGPPPLKKVLSVLVVVCTLIFISIFALQQKDFRHNAAQEDRRPEIMKILADQADQKRRRIEHLYQKLEAITGPPVPAASGGRAENLTLAMVFDSGNYHYETQNILAYAVQSRIKEAIPELILLHRKSLDRILEELIREKPEHLTLRFPELLLFLEVGRPDEKTYVLMQLVRKDTSEVSAVFTETLDEAELILEQKDKIADRLIAHLRNLQRKD